MDLRDHTSVLDYEIGVSITEAQGPPAHPSGHDGSASPPPTGSRLQPAGRSPGVNALRADQLPGKEAVVALAGGIAEQIATMAGQIHTKLAEGDLDADLAVPGDLTSAAVDLAVSPAAPRRPASTYAIDTVTVQFGLTATAKSGHGLAIFADVGGSSSIEVTLTIKRVPSENDKDG